MRGFLLSFYMDFVAVGRAVRYNYLGEKMRSKSRLERSLFVLELKHIKKSYDGMPVLRDISIQVGTGRSFRSWDRPAAARRRCST